MEEEEEERSCLVGERPRWKRDEWNKEEGGPVEIIFCWELRLEDDSCL